MHCSHHVVFWPWHPVTALIFTSKRNAIIYHSNIIISIEINHVENKRECPIWKLIWLYIILVTFVVIMCFQQFEVNSQKSFHIQGSPSDTATITVFQNFELSTIEKQTFGWHGQAVPSRLDWGGAADVWGLAWPFDDWEILVFGNKRHQPQAKLTAWVGKQLQAEKMAY